MTVALAMQRDREVLRSFARRIDPVDAGAHNNLGVLYYHKGMYDEAVAAFGRALELDPQMPVAQRNLEVACFHTGYYERRVAELRARLQALPGDRDARWELARACAALGDAREAVVEFTALLEHHPDDVDAMLQLGMALQASGDAEGALAWFARAQEVDPSHAGVAFRIGDALYHRGATEEARVALLHTIELGPQNADAHYLLGFVLGDLGRHEEARAATQRAIQLNPSLGRAQANLSLDRNNAATYRELVPGRQERRSRQMMQVARDHNMAHYALGLAFRRRGYHAEALREYALALERDEARELVLAAMAEAHLLQRDLGAALEGYDRLLHEQPDNGRLWCERGVAAHLDGRHEDAAACYRRALELVPGYATALNNLGVAQSHAGDQVGAEASFRAALATQPEFVKAWLNLALVLQRGGDSRAGIEAYQQALRVEPEQPVAWNGVGLILAALQRPADARNAFGRAIQARPDYAEAHYNLGFVLSTLGDYDGALRATRRAMELEPYYVAQKFELVIDLEHEDPDLAIAPDLGGPRAVEGAVTSFDFDPRRLDDLFTELAPAAVDDASPADAPATDTPVRPEAPYALAADLMARGLADQAAREITRAMSRGADRATGFTLLGEAFTAQGVHGEALERFRDARRVNGTVPHAMAGEARALLALGRAAEAREVAEQLLAVDAANVDWLLLIARARARTGDSRAARALLERVRAGSPDRADVLKELGDAARACDDVEGAIDAYRGALRLDQHFAVVRHDLALLLAARGDCAGAESELLAALESVPTYVDATLALARVRRRTGRPREAIAPLAELLQRDPWNLEALLALGDALLDVERVDDAARAVERILRLDPRHVDALCLQAELLGRQRRYAEAIATWRRVIALASGGSHARRAERGIRTASDLLRVFRPRGEAA